MSKLLDRNISGLKIIISIQISLSVICVAAPTPNLFNITQQFKIPSGLLANSTELRIAKEYVKRYFGNETNDRDNVNSSCYVCLLGSSNIYLPWINEDGSLNYNFNINMDSNESVDYSNQNYTDDELWDRMILRDSNVRIYVEYFVYRF